MMINRIISSKWFWRGMVVIGVLLMIFGFLNKDLTMWMTAFVIGLLIRYNAYDLLFKDYDDRVNSLREKYRKTKVGSS